MGLRHSRNVPIHFDTSGVDIVAENFEPKDLRVVCDTTDFICNKEIVVYVGYYITLQNEKLRKCQGH